MFKACIEEHKRLVLLFPLHLDVFTAVEIYANKVKTMLVEPRFSAGVE